MGNLGNPRSIASCHFKKYVPSCKSCWYNIKVFYENMDHPETIKIIIIKCVPNYWEFRVNGFRFRNDKKKRTLKPFFLFLKGSPPSFLRVSDIEEGEFFLHMQTTRIAWIMIWNEYETLQNNPIGRQASKSKKCKFWVVAPIYRGIEPIRPGAQASQHSGRQSCHCAIESALVTATSFELTHLHLKWSVCIIWNLQTKIIKWSYI